MEPQIIKSETGDELVVLTRRAYDALLARLGDEEAEDRMTMRIADEARRMIAEGREIVFPAWLSEAAAAGEGSVIRGVRKHRGKSQEEIAAIVGITQGYLSDVERGAKAPTLEVLDRISDALGLDRTWLRALQPERVVGE